MSTHLRLFYDKRIVYIVYLNFLCSSFAHGYYVIRYSKKIYLNYTWDSNRYYQSRSEWTWEQWQWTRYSPKPKNLIFIYRALLWGGEGVLFLSIGYSHCILNCANSSWLKMKIIGQVSNLHSFYISARYLIPYRGKMVQILLAYGLPKETVQKPKQSFAHLKVTDFFDIVTGVL